MKGNLFVHWLPVLLWALFIFITSTNSNPYRSLPSSWARQTVQVQANPGSKRINFNELLGRYLHAAEYLILAALIARAMIGWGDLHFNFLAMAFAISGLYALSDEIHQHFVPGRAFEWSDLALDLGGSVLGVVAFAYIFNLWRRRVH
jgi:VanZ family protein